MAIDPENPVVKLCAAGIQAEMQHQHAEAQRLYAEAWRIHADEYEACIAAHYMARQQDTLELALYWNSEALRHGEAVLDERISEFLPSLYLNLGWSCEMLSHYAEAQQYYALATERAVNLAPGSYGELLKNGIAAAQARISSSTQESLHQTIDL